MNAEEKINKLIKKTRNIKLKYSFYDNFPTSLIQSSNFILQRYFRGNHKLASIEKNIYIIIIYV